MAENEFEKDAEQEQAAEQEAELEAREPEAAAEPEPAEAGQQALAKALKGSFFMLKVAMVALVCFYVAKGIFYVQPEEIRFKLFFGAVVPGWGGRVVLRPGTMHVRWPWEQERRVQTSEQILELPTVFWTNWGVQIGQKKRSLDVRHDGFLITGDANIVHMRLRVRYRVPGEREAALAYAFVVKDAEQILGREAMASVIKVVGSMEVMEVIKRTNLFQAITSELRERLETFERQAGVPLGVEVVAVEAIEREEVKNPTEPAAVSKAFMQAQDAGSQRDGMVEEGESRRNAILEGARARAREMTAEARGKAARLVGMARADAEFMRQLLPIYEHSPEEAAILRDIFYHRAFENALSQSGGAFVLHEPGPGTERELRLQLGRKPPPKKAGGAQQQ
ncbi:MAG: SPFH domain-containing protein [Planctomycetota bacterium]|jgi:regulator of protease activity HflC (stomatin/prohibitin superfamily)